MPVSGEDLGARSLAYHQSPTLSLTTATGRILLVSFQPSHRHVYNCLHTDLQSEFLATLPLQLYTYVKFDHTLKSISNSQMRTFENLLFDIGSAKTRGHQVQRLREVIPVGPCRPWSRNRNPTSRHIAFRKNGGSVLLMPSNAV